MPLHPLLLWTVLLTPLFALLSSLSIVVGVQQPLNPALIGFIEGCEGQPQPCWYGIVPGETSPQQGYRILESRGYRLQDSIVTRFGHSTTFILSGHQQQCWVVLSFDAAIYEIRLEECKDVDLGDLVVAIGLPDGIGTTAMSRGGGVVLEFAAGSIETYAVPFWESPHVTIASVFLMHRFQDSFPGPRWEGFMPKWRYCQLHQDDCLLCRCTS